MTNYLGFGLLADKEFVHALLGRPVKFTESFIKIKGLGLKIFSRDELPISVRDNTEPGFRIYGVIDTPNQEMETSFLRLELSDEELEVVKALNFDGELFDSKPYLMDGNIECQIDFLKDHLRGSFCEDQNPNPFLNGKESAMVLARTLRRTVLEPLRERRPGKELG